MFFCAIIVTGNRTCTDIDARANRGITKIGQVVCLGSRSKLCIFNLDKVADMGALTQSRAWANSSIRPDNCLWPNNGLINRAEGFDLDMLVNLTVANNAVRADSRARTNDDVTFKDAADVNRDILRTAKTATDINTLRIHDADPLVHEFLGELALMATFNIGALWLTVDAKNLVF
jgi:hypothetical protein